MNSQLTAATKPWYRHPWPWILMTGPFVVIVAGVITTYLAVVSNDGLVEDDYYKQGMEINQMTARDKKAVSLGLQAEVIQNEEGTQIRILLRGKPDTVLPQVLNLRIIHPTRSGADQTIALRADGAGFYAGKLSAFLTGRWHVAVEDDKRQWRLTGDWRIEKGAALKLPEEMNAVAASEVQTDNKGR